VPGLAVRRLRLSCRSRSRGLSSHWAAGIAGVDAIARLDEENLGLVLSLGAVLDAAQHDEDLAAIELDVAITQMDRQPGR
jgi:hypothetical protein